MARNKLICNCNRTMPLDGKALARALKLDAEPQVSTELCRRHLAAFAWQEGKVQCVVFAPDGQTAAAGCDRGIVVWDVDDPTS